MHISQLWIYPIKGCQGIPVSQATVEKMGIRFDRRWLVVRAADGQFLTQRAYPGMTRLVPALHEEGLTIAAPGALSLVIPFVPPLPVVRRRVAIWEFQGDAIDAGEEAAHWFSAQIGVPCRLVYAPDDFARRVNPKYAAPADRFGSATERPVAFADGYPLLLTTESSLADLNRRIQDRGGKPVPMDRFRPNIVLAETPAWAEDTFTVIHCGDVRLFAAKPSDRCLVTTIDQRTGDKTGVEPLATLATFRRDGDGKVAFGMNCIPVLEGTLRIGDRVTPIASEG